MLVKKNGQSGSMSETPYIIALFCIFMLIGGFLMIYAFKLGVRAGKGEALEPENTKGLGIIDAEEEESKFIDEEKKSLDEAYERY